MLKVPNDMIGAFVEVSITLCEIIYPYFVLMLNVSVDWIDGIYPSLSFFIVNK
jgi:hypothetical protein